MTIVKRSSAFLCAVALCFSFVLGSLSFMPKCFAVDDYEFPFSQNEIPSNFSSAPYRFGFVWNDSGTYYLELYYSDSPFSCSLKSWLVISGSSISRLVYSSHTNKWSSYFGNKFSLALRDVGSPLPFSSNIDATVVRDASFSYSFSRPIAGKSYFVEFSPFYFPELPYGYFDGHINSIDGSFNLDYPSSSISGSINHNGFDTYSLTLPNTSGSGEFNFNDTTGIGSGSFNTSSGSGTISQTAVSTDTITLNVQDVPITYTPTYNEISRFRSWAVVSGSSYCYFVCDSRNTISGSLESVTGDKGKLRFSAVGSDGVHYPFFCIEFAFDGTKLQTLQALPNGFTVDFKGGSLVQDSDTGIWSCDPLYHGFWLSDGCPPVVLSSLSDETYKWLSNPVFGDDAFILNFLNAINENISGLRSDLTSLQSAMQSSISGQTSDFQNMDAPSNFDPTDVNNMLQYGTLESDFHAPSTDDIFSVDSGTFTDGMGFWRDRMNELLFFSGSPALPMTIFSLTLGLAVLIIGRRVSGGGAA